VNDDELEMIWKKAVVVHMKGTISGFAWTEEHHEKPQSGQRVFW
jgi:hypothetical protein